MKRVLQRFWHVFGRVRHSGGERHKPMSLRRLGKGASRHTDGLTRMAFLNLFLLVLAFGSPALTQLLTTTEFVSTGTCIKRSLLYTSGSSTYMLSEYGSTSNFAAPTQYACNATVTLPPITTTLMLGNASSPACSSFSGPVSGSQPLISDGGFELGTVIPFDTSSSSSGVSARIVQGCPIAPAAGSSYL